MSKLKFRFLGGFEVWRDDQRLRGFESQKSRALLAYLVCNRVRAFSRSHVAGLLWPEKEEASARHGLRQALYNLRSTLRGDDSDDQLVLTTQQTIQFDPAGEHWVDIEEFDQSLKRGARGQEIDTHELARASQIYRGDFLGDLIVKDSPQFEEWLVGEQERLREAAIELLRKLVGNYLERGDYRMGLQYGRRLVTVDPFSEESHRQVMKLYAMGGRRNRALAHYENLRNLLNAELGVEPLDETRALYEAILTETADTDPAPLSTVSVGPMIPLVGRQETYATLRSTWHSVLKNGGRVTLVQGELGIGKSRLIKSFLDAATSRRRAFVLKGRCYPLGPTVSYEMFSEILRNAFLQEMPSFWDVLRNGTEESQQDLVRLVPDLAHSALQLPPPEPAVGEPSRERFFETVSRALGLYDAARGFHPRDPVILFVDDLQWADPASLGMLVDLAPLVAKAEMWIVAAIRGAEPTDRLRAALDGICPVEVIDLERLDGDNVSEIALSLVGEREAPLLADFLERHAKGLPLFLTELINHLWDSGALLSESESLDGLEERLGPIETELEGGTLEEIIVRRLHHLPNSTKRLGALAAVIGQTFEAGLLQEAADEHRTVVEVGLEILLERWIIRQFADQWNETRPEADIVMWAGGARRGRFEFAHKLLRTSIYESVHLLRRQVMHREVAEAIEAVYSGQTEKVVEQLAHHYREAGLWERALPYLVQSAERAASLFDVEQACEYYATAAKVLRRLLPEAGRAQRQEWAALQETIDARLSELAPAGVNST